MDKLLNILSELQITSEYISTEIGEIEMLYRKISESAEAYRGTCEEIQQKSKEIVCLTEEEQSLFAKIKNREKEYARAMEKLEDIQREYETLARFDEGETGWSGNDNLKFKTNLFGIDVHAQYLEPTVYQAKISFAENKFIIFNCDLIQNTYDLQAMEPTHKNYAKMRRFLLESGDIVGFLSRVRAFFGQ